MSTRPTRARTWALRGQTPLLQETFNWKSLSITGGLALWRFYFQIHPGSIKSLQVIEFLRHLQRHIPGKILVVWDGAPIHRSVLVRDYILSTHGRIQVERFPAYATELNPLEYMWSKVKQILKSRSPRTRRQLYKAAAAAFAAITSEDCQGFFLNARIAA